MLHSYLNLPIVVVLLQYLSRQEVAQEPSLMMRFAEEYQRQRSRSRKKARDYSFEESFPPVLRRMRSSSLLSSGLVLALFTCPLVFMMRSVNAFTTLGGSRSIRRKVGSGSTRNLMLVSNRFLKPARVNWRFFMWAGEMTVFTTLWNWLMTPLANPGIPSTLKLTRHKLCAVRSGAEAACQRKNVWRRASV